jgi:hypothetical protein
MSQEEIPLSQHDQLAMAFKFRVPHGGARGGSPCS